MGKYIKLFDNQESYDSFKNSSNYVEPNISFVKDTGSLINDRLQISPEGESAREMVYLNYYNISNDYISLKCKSYANIIAGVMDGNMHYITWGEYWSTKVYYESGSLNYYYSIHGIGLDLSQLVYDWSNGKLEWITIGDSLKKLCELEGISFDDVVSEAGLTEEEFFSMKPY